MMLRPLVLAGLMLLVEGVKAKSGKDSRLPGEGTWRLRYRTLWAEGSGCSEEYMDVQVLCPNAANCRAHDPLHGTVLLLGDKESCVSKQHIWPLCQLAWMSSAFFALTCANDLCASQTRSKRHFPAMFLFPFLLLCAVGQEGG